MQRHRFYSPLISSFDSTIILDTEESHHLSRVLRLLPGAKVFSFDGKGIEYECEVKRVNKDRAELSIISRLSNEVESPLQLTLAQALVKGDKFDWVVQKATELGVSRLVPLLTKHTEFKNAENREARLQRWRRIALEATKQCGRRHLIEITDAQDFEHFCATNSNDLRLIFSERKGKGLDVLTRPTAITIAIGPEGGWSETEILQAEAANFVQIHLGNRILRTETAAISAVAIVQYLFGDLV